MAPHPNLPIKLPTDILPDPRKTIIDANTPSLHPEYSNTDDILSIPPREFECTIATLADGMQQWHATGLSAEKPPMASAELSDNYFRYKGINLASFRAECIRNNKVAVELQSRRAGIEAELGKLWPHWKDASEAAARKNTDAFAKRCEDTIQRHADTHKALHSAVGHLVHICETRQKSTFNPLASLSKKTEEASILPNFSLLIGIALNGNPEGDLIDWLHEAGRELLSTNHFLDVEGQWKWNKLVYYDTFNSGTTYSQNKEIAKALLDGILKIYNQCTAYLHSDRDAEAKLDQAFAELTHSRLTGPDYARELRPEFSSDKPRETPPPTPSPSAPLLIQPRDPETGTPIGPPVLPSWDGTPPAPQPQQPSDGGTAANGSAPVYPTPMRPGDRVAYPQPPAGYQGP